MRIDEARKALAGKRISDLDQNEREQYYELVCESFGLPAELRLLEYTTMKNEEGQNTLVLYARKAATDLLRNIHGIDITKLTTEIAGEMVICTAEGVDKKGHRDMAVGSASLRGLTGKQLGYQPMVAQTRASRRLTLQLAGCGFLDESEVTELIEPASKIVPAVEAPAIPVANNEPGTEIKIVSETNINHDTGAVEHTKKRRRRTKAEIEAAKNSPAIPQETAAAPIAAFSVEPVVQAAMPTKEEPPVQTPAPTIIIDRPNTEQIKAYRARVSKYSNDILPEAGMMPSEGMGINAKVRKFAQIMCSGADLNNLTVAQWDAFLGFMDNEAQKNGAASLVKIIEGKIKNG